MPLTANDALLTPMIVYADGSCINNGKAQARAGIGVYWEWPPCAAISERLSGKQTNQCAEIFALVRVFQTDPHPDRPLIVRSDSVYAINCMTTWISNWQRRNWRNSKGQPVENSALIQMAHYLSMARAGSVKYEHVRAHTGIAGNEEADRLAVKGAWEEDVPLRDWVLELKKLRTMARPKDVTSNLKADCEAKVEGNEELDEAWFMSSDEEAEVSKTQNF